MKDVVSHQQPLFVTHPIRRPIVILFCDDSTLFFALRMRSVLVAANPDLPIDLAWYVDESILSYRQMSQLLPAGPTRVLTKKALELLVLDPSVQAIITSRVFRPLQIALNAQVRRLQAGRPCVIAFLGGLDFSPEAGFARRKNCDAVYLFPICAEAAFRASQSDTSWQETGFGHPAFLRPDGLSEHKAKSDITFFAQALSPSTKSGRLHMVRALAAIARRNPTRRVWIKLRHLPHENRAHLHREKYDYPGLLACLPDVPSNLMLTSLSMDDILETTALGITCTSTAAIDLLREGLPVMVHLDYVDAYRDPLVEPMRRLFAGSNLITSLDDLLHLRARAVNEDWLATMLCPRDLGQRVMETVTRFESRPFQIMV
jgi:hypothetical protein